MRLDRVALKGFLSHSDTDWRPGDARLVTLVGPNGAGKSSLAVDGQLYALFDDARGRTDELVQAGATDMSVTVEFVHAGGRYRVTRGRTTRSGGRSRLELAIQLPDTSWRPLTGDSIQDTQAMIEDLLRVDAATYETAVVLVQGDAMRFAQATAGERKRIVSTVLDLGLYPAAEGRAKDKGLELAGQLRSDQARVLQVDDAIAELQPVPDLLVRRRADVDQLALAIAATTGDRAVSDARLTELAGLLATGAAAEADVTRLTSEIQQLAGRHRDAGARKVTAEGRATEAAATIAGAGDDADPTERIQQLTAEVERLERIRDDAATLDVKIMEATRAHSSARALSDVEHATWQSAYEAARTSVDSLAAAVTGQPAIECPKCHHTWHETDTALQEQLTTARRRFLALEANQPKQPLSLSREAAALARRESTRRDLAVDRPAIAAARTAIAALQAIAARAEAIGAARRAKDQAVADVAATATELDEITGLGIAARASLTNAQKTVAGLASFHEERSSLETWRGELDRLIADDTRAHGEAVADVVRLEGLTSRLEGLLAERAALTLATQKATFEISLLKRLAGAFGPNGIPARIIESVLPELTGYAQELLGELRPGMSLSIRAKRATKDGKGLIDALDLVVQDAAGERPLAMFSGGERMSVSLALAVGLSRLVARRAGTALRTLVIDEPDGLDADARRAFGHALRVLAHHGELERVVLVTHHEDLADVGDTTFRVTKNGHGSVVEEV